MHCSVDHYFAMGKVLLMSVTGRAVKVLNMLNLSCGHSELLDNAQGVLLVGFFAMRSALGELP